jgi:hypothetical protein
MRAKPDQGDIWALAGGHRADLSDVDRPGDHLMPEAGNDLCEQLEPVAALIRDQDAEVLNFVSQCVSGYAPVCRASTRGYRSSPRSPRKPAAKCPSSAEQVGAIGRPERAGRR